MIFSDRRCRYERKSGDHDGSVGQTTQVQRATKPEEVHFPDDASCVPWSASGW